MKSPAEHIILNTKFSVNSLNTRATAKRLVKSIEKSWANTVILDFFDIDFASRSFMDELNSHLPHIDKEIKKINMNPSVNEMDELVQRPKEINSNSSKESEPELMTF